MKWFSITEFLQSMKSILSRFPIAFILLVIGVYCAVDLVEVDYNSGHHILMNMQIVCMLGLPLFISIQLIAERYELKEIGTWLLKACGLGLLMLYYFYLPIDFKNAPAEYYYRTALLWIGLHLLVAFAAFIGSKDVDSFWEFNKRLFLRLVAGVIFTVTVFLGLVLALLALKYLFNVQINDKRYLQLWVCCTGLINTLYFFGGVPKVNNSEVLESTYPKGLRIFTSYVLLPLVIIYLFILYAYMGKILITRTWPREWVSDLVIGFSTVGILAGLLVWPIRNNIERPWIKLYARWLFIALIPLTIMLAIAIYKRVNQYGVTNDRYIIMVTAGWLLFISLYFIFRKFYNIKIIPVTLSIIIFIISIGPLSMFSVSHRSQFKRLQTILNRNGIMKDGYVAGHENHRNLSDSISYQITDLVQYLCKNYGKQSLEPLFKDIFKDSVKRFNNRYDDYYDYSRGADEVMALMGVKSIDYYSADNESANVKSFGISCPNNTYYDISGYEILLHHPFDYRYSGYSGEDTDNYFILKEKNFVHYTDSTQQFILRSSKRADTINLSLVIDSIVKAHDFRPYFNMDKAISFNASSNRFNCKFILYDINGTYNPTTLKLTEARLQGYVLLKQKYK